ncbi:conserved membrane hypothetical protein [Hyella patelloides LEGE 07179]|uniref:Ycf36 protein n=1 Tax=Hyella patelloides LEGE 07179 TaxID=945734 RepID=A0A563VKP2_9CYAN|nr:CGLD27 family protein [Hyella patelloides]VEP11988.1 conserved membrane hypothetical protein [Hyella patelloides LEGE 07179]
MNKSATQFCPVPQEQQPTHEYQQLQDSWFFSWATLEPTDYIKKLLGVGFATSIIAAPIAAASFLPTKYPVKFFLSSIGGMTFLTALVLFQLYFGWSYVCDRLYQERISYEESGWYDGQVWLKPESMLTRDRLIVGYEVQPILDRIKKTFVFLLCIVIVGSIIWFV